MRDRFFMLAKKLFQRDGPRRVILLQSLWFYKQTFYNKLFWENNIITFEISTLEYFLIANFRKKMKMPECATKNATFGYFWAKIF